MLKMAVMFIIADKLIEHGLGQSLSPAIKDEWIPIYKSHILGNSMCPSETGIFTTLGLQSKNNSLLGSSFSLFTLGQFISNPKL